MDRVLTSTNVPAAFRRVRLHDYDTSRNHDGRNIFEQIEEWDPTDSKPALLMQGPPGVAKTMMASALLNEYHAQYPMHRVKDTQTKTVFRQERLPIYFIQLSAWVALQIRTFKLHDLVMKGLTAPDEYLEIDQLLQDLHNRVKVLVVDDVGKEHHTSTGFSEDAFDLLVRTRHNNGLVTIYTTNLPLSRWSSEYSESMSNFIKRSSRVVKF